MIYFIRDGDAVKIGFAADPKNRLRSLRTGNSRKIFILGVMDGGLNEEAALHLRFGSDRIRGEWFRLSHEIISFIEERCRAVVDISDDRSSPGSKIFDRPKTKLRAETVSNIKMWMEDDTTLKDGESETAQMMEWAHMIWSNKRGQQSVCWTAISRVLLDCGCEKFISGRGVAYSGIMLSKRP